MVYTTLIIVLLFSVLFGAIVFMLTNFLIRRFGKERKGSNLKHIWVWRAVIFLTILYMIIVLVLNRNTLDLAMAGPLNFLLMAFLIVFFVTLVEIAIIDLFLPDVILLWKRILLEVILFFILTASSLGMFVFYSVIQGI